MLKKAAIVQKAKTTEHTRTERQVLEHIRQSPFLVTLHYAFQTQSKLHLILGEWWSTRTKYGELLSSSVLKRWIDVLFMFLSITVCLFVGLMCNICVCVIFCIMSIQAPCVFVCVCEYRLCEWRGDVHSFVPAGSLSWGGGADLYRGNNPGSGAPAQGGCCSFQLYNVKLHLSIFDTRGQMEAKASLQRHLTDVIPFKTLL